MFKKEIVESIKGTQQTKWDQHYAEFDQPGATLFALPTDMKAPAASQFAARMNKLEEMNGGKRKFHSGFNVLKQMNFVRVRPEGEVPDKEEEKEQLDLNEE